MPLEENMKRTCLVASDEEDEDGNLSEINPLKRTRPLRSVRKKVTCFSEDAGSSQSEEEDDNKKSKTVKNGRASTGKRGRPRGNQRSNTIKETTTVSTNIGYRPIMPKPLVATSTNNECSPTVKLEPGTSEENVSKHSSTENSISSKEKPSTSNEGQKPNFYVKRGKYDRQATPICDAIMKEYSKRQKLMKMQGKKESPDLSDLPIKEIIDKAKREAQVKASAPTSKENNSTADQSKAQVPQSQVSGMDVPAQDEHNNSKNTALGIPIKQEMDSNPKICDKKEIKISNIQSLQPIVRIKREDLSPVISKVRSDIDEEDPTWTPEMLNESTRRSRSSKFTSKSANKLKNLVDERSCPSPPKVSNHQSLNVVSKLKTITESINDLLNSGDSLIDNEDEKLLHSTQEIIKLQNEKIQMSYGMTAMPRPNFKQDVDGDSNSNSLPLQQVNLSENDAVYSKDRCTFMMQFFTSYQEVFTLPVLQDAIPLLSEILLLCMNSLKESLQRIKIAHTVTILELRHQEVQLASKAYQDVVMSYGERFFNQFDTIVANIVGTKTPKPVMITLIYFIINSLFNKSSNFNGQLHKARAVLLLISRIYKYHHPLVWEVLELSDHIYEDELKDLIQIIKYYYDRNLAIIPAGNLFSCLLENSEKNQHIESLDLSLLNDLVVEIKIPPSLDKSRQKYSYEKEITQSLKLPSTSKKQRKIPSSKLSNMTASLFEKLQNEENYDSRKIEHELDLILAYLSDIKNQMPENLTEQLPVSDELIDESGGSKDNLKRPNTVQPKNAGLDNLLMLKSKTFKVKTEPLEENEDEIQPTTRRSLRSNNSKSLDSKFGDVKVKEEPEEYNEPPPFSSVVIPEPHLMLLSEFKDETAENEN